MMPASTTPVATPTLPRLGPGNDDGSSQGGAFRAVLTDVGHSAVPAAATEVSQAPASTATKREGQRDARALLAQISSGSAATLPTKKGAAAADISSPSPPGDHAKSAGETADTTKDTTQDTAAATDIPHGDASSLAAALVAMPYAISTTVTTPSKDANVASATVRSRTSASTSTAGGHVDTPDLDAPTDVAITVVGTTSHLTPASTSIAGGAAADAASATPFTKDAGPQPDASLPAGTLQTIGDSIASLADEAAGALTPAPAAPQSTYLAPARSLTLQLSPGALGSVTVHLHMTSNGLDLHLAVENDKTLGALTRSRDELTAAIGDSGYKLDSLTIRSADPSSAMAGSNDSPRNDTTSGGGAFADNPGRRGSGGEGEAQRPRNGAPPREAATAGDRGGDGVFV